MLCSRGSTRDITAENAMNDHMGLGEVAQEMNRQYDKWGEQDNS